MTKVVIFDLYDTIVKGVSFDFDKGMEYLYRAFFTNVCTWEELLAYSKTFLPLYEARKENNIELSFIREELPFYFTKLIAYLNNKTLFKYFMPSMNSSAAQNLSAIVTI